MNSIWEKLLRGDNTQYMSTSLVFHIRQNIAEEEGEPGHYKSFVRRWPSALHFKLSFRVSGVLGNLERPKHELELIF
jgi:hypothetical protein